MTNVPSEYLSIKILGDSRNYLDVGGEGEGEEDMGGGEENDNYNLRLEIFTSNMIKLFITFKFRWDYQYTKYIKALVNTKVNQEFLSIALVSYTRFNNSGQKYLEEYINLNKLSINNMFRTVYGFIPSGLNSMYIALYTYIRLLQSIDSNENEGIVGIMMEDMDGDGDYENFGEDF